ncbi:MAG: hypothetical protein RR410_05465 [Alistipes sp.]
MMRLLLLSCGLLLTTPLIFAQQNTAAPEKEVILVDFFSRIREVPAPYLEQLREQVLGGFVDRGRHRIIDAEASRSLAASVPGTGVTDPAMAAADMDAFLEARAPQALAAGARYLVSGVVVGYHFEHVALPGYDNRHRPLQGFKSGFRVILSALDLKLGQRIADKAYDLTGTAPIAEDADRVALASIRSSIEYYIDFNFKFETSILELCPPDRKHRIRELYIHSGTQMGVRLGDLFMVYEEVPIGGVVTRQKVGRLRVDDVENPDVAKCKITAGDAEIATAFSAGRTLICISDSKALFY